MDTKRYGGYKEQGKEGLIEIHDSKTQTHYIQQQAKQGERSDITTRKSYHL